MVQRVHNLGMLLSLILTLATGLVPVASAAGVVPRPVVAAQLPLPTVVVDPKLTPALTTIPTPDRKSSLPVARIAGPHGDQGDFVEDEVLLFTADRVAIDKFAARWKGVVLSSLDPAKTKLPSMPPMALVRITSSLASAATLPQDLRKAAPLSLGTLRVSSKAGLLTLAVAAQENAGGLKAGLNWLLAPDRFHDGQSSEGSAGFVGADGLPYSNNACSWPYMNLEGPQDVGVCAAWAALEATGKLANKVPILVLDSGFDPNVVSPGGPTPNPDFPAGTTILPAGSAGVGGPGSCGGSPCPFHGTEVTLAGMAVPDNAAGAAGPGGPVAQLTLVSSPSSDISAEVQYLLTVIGALAQGPKILNISAGVRIPAGACLAVCGVIDTVSQVLRGAGILVFASAGNEGQDVDAQDCFLGICWEAAVTYPCEAHGVICAGGLRWNAESADPNSNWGSDGGDLGDTAWLFAPYDVWVFDGHQNQPGPGGPGAVYLAHGTSFAAPFDAGVAALVWAANPALTADQVAGILLSTAHTSSDPKVPRSVNAFGAVKQAMGGHVPPSVTIDTPADGTRLPLGAEFFFHAFAHDADDGNLSDSVTWTSNIDGALGTGSFSRALSLGTHTITATVADHGFSDHASVSVTVYDPPPVMRISQPYDGQVFFLNQDIPLVGSSNASQFSSLPLPAAQVSWQVDGAGQPLATGYSATIPHGTLGLGQHTITFTGTDGTVSASAGVSITILPQPVGAPPRVTITSPAAGATFTALPTGWQNGPGGGMTVWTAQVTLQGSALDQFGQVLPDANLTWYIGNTAGTGIGHGATLNATIPVFFPGSHTVPISLSAMDSQHATSTATITITVVTQGS